MATEGISVPWWRTDLGDAEIEAVSRAIRDRHVHHGPLCGDLEAALAARIDLPHVVSTTSGSMGLVLAMLACGVGPGTEVVVPALTFIAPAHAALLLGARVRLVDVRADRPLVDTDALAAVVGERTRAIVVVHLNGRAADVGATREVAGRVGARVIEDCAQALCSHGTHGCLGGEGDLATFSLGITKLVTAGEGGFVATRDAQLGERLRRLRNHGTVSIAHNVFPEIGGNFRLADLQAAVALAQLERVDAKIAGVRRVYAAYRAGLRGLPWIDLVDVHVERGELPLWTEARAQRRDEVVRALRDHGVEAKPFHPCLAASPHLRDEGDFPRATSWAATGVTLPSGPDQPDAHIERTLRALATVGQALGLAGES